MGSSKPLINKITFDHHYGEDGFGDFEFEEEIIGKIDRSKHASLALVDLARENAGKFVMNLLQN